MSTDKKQTMFTAEDGRNLVVTFILVSSLFLLWGVCNGMIDVMDKHFQDELGLSKAQSAWVQFAHYLGYFLMALPAGWLAIRLGYKGGIIAGLLLVAIGGFWFVPATKINALVHAGSVSPNVAFVGYLAGVCAIAAGLTFLETIANPYTTVLGPSRYAAARINLAQSCNGIGWIFGPIIGGLFFYTKDAATGRSTGSETLYIPYVIVGFVVLVLAGIFYFAYIPDIKTEDDYHLDDSAGATTSHSIWKHPHFYMAVLAQFLYVAAQAGIFSFFINYMTSEVPSVPASWRSGKATQWIEVQTTFVPADLQDLPVFVDKLKKKADPVSSFVYTQLSSNTVARLESFTGGSNAKPLKLALVQDLNQLVKQDPTRVKPERLLADQRRFNEVALSERSKELLAAKEKKQEISLAELNRHLLHDAYPKELAFNSSKLTISDKGASFLASIGFFCFLIGRFTGAGLLRKFSAHKILGLYGVMNILMCLLVFSKLGWVSVACVFLSYFFMSIMFPTIFALGIFGLGVRAKKASGYIVMAIMGGAILPKLMGYVADQFDMSRGFIVPLFCFAFVAFYGFSWPRLSRTGTTNAGASAPRVGAAASH